MPREAGPISEAAEMCATSTRQPYRSRESKRLNVQKLPAGENRIEIALIWRKGAGSSRVKALQELLTGKARA